MTYGTLDNVTKAVIEDRAKAEGIDVESLGLEPAWDVCNVCYGHADGVVITCSNEVCEDGYIRPEFLREVYITYGGATDQTFYLDATHAGDVVDWIADNLRENDHPLGAAYREHWEVALVIPYFEGSDEIYSVNSEDE